MRIPARPRLSEVCRLGTASTPGLATNLSTSIRRWRKTSAATVDAAAQERSAGSVCWGGNAKGRCGFIFVNRLSFNTLKATGMRFFGPMGSTSALAATLPLSAAVIRLPRRHGILEAD